MEFYFTTKGATIHLYRENGLFDEDLGALSEKSRGKLKTNNFTGENFELEDISGFFSKGKRYSIKSSKGINGIIEKKGFSGRYLFRPK